MGSASRRGAACLAVLVTAFACTWGGSPSKAPSAAATSFTLSLSGPHHLVTNDYAFHHPSDPASHRSDQVEVTSGSFFIQGGLGTGGAPDDASPATADSGNGTGSAVFRMRTVRSDFDNVTVAVRFRVDSLGATGRTPSTDYDGLHVWVRYVSEARLYAVSVFRRGGGLVIKRKTPGGPSNGGTYDTLAHASVQPAAGVWHEATVRAVDSASGVTLTLDLDGKRVLEVDDTSPAAIKGGGRIGLRGDNALFFVSSFSAT